MITRGYGDGMNHTLTRVSRSVGSYGPRLAIIRYQGRTLEHGQSMVPSSVNIVSENSSLARLEWP